MPKNICYQRNVHRENNDKTIMPLQLEWLMKRLCEAKITPKSISDSCINIQCYSLINCEAICDIFVKHETDANQINWLEYYMYK